MNYIKITINKTLMGLLLAFLLLSVQVSAQEKFDVNSLTIREKIGQTVIVESRAILQEYTKDISLEQFFSKYPVGGVFVGTEGEWKVGADSLNMVITSIKQYQKASKIPLIICSDMETGANYSVKGLTSMTSLTGIGAIRDTLLASQHAKATALEARSVGVNWIFNPVADLAMNPFNYIIATRSVSDNPTHAIPLLKSYVQGFQNNSIAATAKHFPGDGVDYINQHLTTSANLLSLNSWENSYQTVFQELINDGVLSIMVGHIALPCYQPKKEIVNGRYLPATLSPSIITDLLKGEMGFEGVVVSDALTMGGFNKFFSRTESALRTLTAGSDMLLWPTLDYFKAVEEAIQNGELSMERLDEAVRRVWALKEKLGILDPQYQQFRTIQSNEKEFVKITTQATAEKSITLLRDRHNSLPLNSKDIKNVLIIYSSYDKEQGVKLADNLKSELQSIGIEVAIRDQLWYTNLEELSPQFDLIIYAIGKQILQPWHGNGLGINWTANMYGRDKSIVISFDNPFHSDEFKASDIYINTYSDCPFTIKSVVGAIFGEIPFNGKSPYNLTMTRSLDYFKF